MSLPLPFAKMNGAGNEILVVDERGRPPTMTGEEARRIGQGHLAFDLRQRTQVRRKHDADHGSVCTSTDSTAGRSRTMGAQVLPASADA